MVEYEAAAVHAARALSALVEQEAADEASAAAMARNIARTPLSPPPAAVALGAPRLHIGVLYIAHPPRLVIFQQNNSAALQQFWRTLASAWNASSVVWSNAWFSCEEGTGWWGGAAAARGAWSVRAAAALFRRIPAVPCEDTMHDWLGGAPLCDPATTECEATPAYGLGDRHLEVIKLYQPSKYLFSYKLLFFQSKLNVIIITVPLQMPGGSLASRWRWLDKRCFTGQPRRRQTQLHVVRDG